MKTRATLSIAVLALGLAAAAAAQRRAARDLYLAGSEQGAPGAKLSIELSRGGSVSWVAPDTPFRSGDKVRFHFATNFTGYVAVINVGSTGRRSLLFPYKGVSNRIQPTSDYQVPQGAAWFQFDDNPGQEQLTFIMSTNPIADLPAAGGAPTSAPAAAGSQGGQVTGAEEQAILDALNSRALRNGRDLVLESSGSDAFLVSNATTLASPAGFSVTLVHK